jgi:hypothetical protein
MRKANNTAAPAVGTARMRNGSRQPQPRWKVTKLLRMNPMEAPTAIPLKITADPTPRRAGGMAAEERANWVE